MSRTVKSYQDLEVWQVSMDLAQDVYRLTKVLPPEEKYGVTQEARRAAVSIPANIAEGHGSSHRRVYLNHLSIAKGSLTELDTYLILMMRLGYLDRRVVEPAQERVQSVGRMLSALIRALKASPPTPNPQPPIPNP